MYTQFFGLKETPFNSTQDPRFFFPSPQHEEALASLVYAAQERKGLVVVTGEVGSGKSLVSHMLVNRLGQAATTAVMSTSHLGDTDLLHGILREFRMPIDGGVNTMEMLATFEDYLLSQYSKQRVVVLIIDDAHALSEKNFEQLRLVSNLEVAEGKLLQIVLTGQKDLTHILHKPSSKQLRQRIFRNFHITRLSRDLTEDYIQFRMGAAGSEAVQVFDYEAVDLIYQYSNGVPRLVNNLCDNLLLSAYSDQAKVIDSKRVNAVIDEMMSVPETSGADAVDACPDDVDQAISEITNQYVRSLEAQIGELESTSTETDQRIHELHRLSAKLRAQELTLNTHQAGIDAKIRDLHRSTVTLQELERNLSQREKSISKRVEESRILSDRLETQDKVWAEREAGLSQQLREIERQSAVLIEQDRKLTERANFIDKKLASRQVSFDRELNECKRAINRKWHVIKQLIVQYETKETSRAKRLAAVDKRLLQFTDIESQLGKTQAKMEATLQESNHSFKNLSEAQVKLVDHAKNVHKELAAKAEKIRDGAVTKITQTQEAARDTAAHLKHLMEKTEILLNQPKEMMDKTARQMEQVDRMTQLVQRATESLQQTVKGSLKTSQHLNTEGKKLAQRLEEIEEEAVASMKDLEKRSSKTGELREVLRQIYQQADSRVKELKTIVVQADSAMAKLPKQLEQLHDNTVHPTRLMKELRSVGSATERNLHDGQLRLAELRTMIEKADRARQSIEALIHATRRVADKRRVKVAGDGKENALDITTTRTPEPLSAKIESLTEAVKKARARSTLNMAAMDSPPT